jgi:hypothetical protein
MTGLKESYRQDNRMDRIFADRITGWTGFFDTDDGMFGTG